jgi:hypothetical protein
MLQVINLAIGLSFVYLLFSLIMSAVNESVLAIFRSRARFLEEGMAKLLGSAETWKQVRANGLIQSLAQGEDGKPAYIPASTFVTAFLDHVCPLTPDELKTGRQFANLVDAVGKGVLASNSFLNDRYRTLLAEAKGDVSRFESAIEDWFDKCTDRVSGWYKGRSQWVLLLLSFALAIAANVDSIHIVLGLTADPALTEKVVTAATDAAKKSAANSADLGNGDLAVFASQTRDALAQLNSVSLPIGWSNAQNKYLFSDIRPADPLKGQQSPFDAGWNWAHIVSAILGWLLTALAASLGAPFWFDMLNRLTNVRAEGLSPAESKLKRAKQTRSINSVPKPADSKSVQ